MWHSPKRGVGDLGLSMPLSVLCTERKMIQPGAWTAFKGIERCGTAPLRKSSMCNKTVKEEKE